MPPPFYNSQAYIPNRSIAVSFVEEATQGTNVAIAYIYCNYKDPKTQSEVEILSSITRQLAEQIHPLPPEVKVFSEKNAKRRRPPTEDERLSLVRSLCLLFRRTYVFVDALVIFSYLRNGFIESMIANLFAN